MFFVLSIQRPRRVKRPDTLVPYPQLVRSERGEILVLNHSGRRLDHRERFSGDLPGLLRLRQWLRVDLVPAPVGGAIMLRDISEAMEDFAAGGMRAAMLNALEIDGGIGHARISVRGTVESAKDRKSTRLNSSH